jgi:hypothetical protein
MSTPQFKVGDVVTYQTLDEESYTRGYGVHMETKASTIISIYYKLANGDLVQENKLVRVQQETKEEPKTSK